MKGKTTLVGILVLLGIFLGVVPTKVFAIETCASKGITVVSSNFANAFPYGQPVSLSVTLGSSGTPGLVAGGSDHLQAKHAGSGHLTDSPWKTVQGGQLQWPDWNEGSLWLGVGTLSSPGEHQVVLHNNIPGVGSLGLDGCLVGTYTVNVGGIDCAYLRVSKEWLGAPSNGNQCFADATHCVEATRVVNNLHVSARLTNADGSLYTSPVFFSLSGPGNAGNDESVGFNTSPANHPQEYFHGGWSPDYAGTFTITVKLNGQGGQNPPICRGTFLQSNSCQNCNTTPNNIAEQINDPYALEHHAYKICDQVSNALMTPEGANAKDRCIACIGGDELGRAGIWTAVGCIPREPEKIVNSLLRLGLGMGGGFALIIILASGFVLSTSQGEPKRIEDAKGWLTSALVGMLFIIFSVTLLHFIGYSIFKIPGFGGP